MSAFEVDRLRRLGLIEEALNLAVADFEAYRNDPLTQSSLFWVLYDICINLLKTNDIQQAKSIFERMTRFLPTMNDEQSLGRRKCAELMMHFDDTAKTIADAEQISKMDPVEAYDIVKQLIAQPSNVSPLLHEQLGWIIYRYAKNIAKEENSYNVRCQLRDYLRLSNDKPSLLHSCFLMFALNFKRSHNDFIFHNFLKMWNCEKFREEDFQPQKKSGGIEYSPLAYQAAMSAYESIVSRNDKAEGTVRWLCYFYDLLIFKYSTDQRLQQLRVTMEMWLPREY